MVMMIMMMMAWCCCDRGLGTCSCGQNHQGGKGGNKHGPGDVVASDAIVASCVKVCSSGSSSCGGGGGGDCYDHSYVSSGWRK